MKATKSFLLTVLVAACSRSAPEVSPLGSLGPSEIAPWQQECSTALVSERVCGRLRPEACDGKFHTIFAEGTVLEQEPGSSATLKRTCASEGWGIWTDNHDRIVALCVAGTHQLAATVRLQQFVTRHRNAEIADKIVHFIKGEQLDGSTDRWSSWTDWNMVPKPREMTEQRCIEFRLL